MIRRFLLGSAAGLLLAWPGPAALAASWKIDQANSSLGFAGSQSGTPFQGHFGKWQGEIDFDPANPAAGHAHIVIDMGSATTGDPQKDESLPQPDWFSVKAFPQAMFEASSFRSKGGNAYEAVGSLAIRGVKKDVVLPFTFEENGGVGHAVGKLDILRSDYGVGQGEWSSGQMVALAVSVTVDIRASH